MYSRSPSQALLRMMPLPELLYAQVVKSSRRRRLVGGKDRVVGGTMDRVHRSCRCVAGRCTRRLSKG
jgi:hypothetical protein